MPALPPRPRSAPELVDAAIQLLRRHYAQFATLGAIAFLPSVLVQIYTAYGMREAGPQVGRIFFFLVVTWLWQAIMEGAIQFAAAEAYLGNDVGVDGAVRHAAARTPPLLNAVFVKWMAIWFGLIFFIVPGVLLFARYFAIPATVVIENMNGRDALARSRRLAEGQRGRILATLGLGWLLYAAVWVGVYLLLAALAGAVAAQVVTVIVLMFVYPLLGILGVVLYFDVRIRKEGYDIELLAAAAPDQMAS